MPRILPHLLAALLLAPLVGCDDSTDGDGAGGSGGGAPAGQPCETFEECPLLVCRCVDDTIPSQGCAGRTGAMTCETTCEGTCVGNGGVDPAHPETCVDPATASTGTPGAMALGERCVASGDSGDCAGGICLPKGDLLGLCSAECLTDAECAPLVCRTFTRGGTTAGLCAEPTTNLCDG